MGYLFGVTAYQVWIPKERKCVTSRNIVFIEEEMYKHTFIHHEDECKETEILESSAKKKQKKVTFKEDLIKDPTPTSPTTETEDSLVESRITKPE